MGCGPWIQRCEHCKASSSARAFSNSSTIATYGTHRLSWCNHGHICAFAASNQHRLRLATFYRHAWASQEELLVRPYRLWLCSPLIFHASPRFLVQFNIRIRDEIRYLPSETSGSFGMRLDGEFSKNDLWCLMVIEPICLISRKRPMDMLSATHCLRHTLFRSRLIILYKGSMTCKGYSVALPAISMGRRTLTKNYQRCVR